MQYRSFTRWLKPVLDDSLSKAPAVFVNGPRQSGKSTLVKQLTADPIRTRYVTLDDLSVRAAAEKDPLAFLRAFEGPAIIDEVQLAPGLFRSLKMIIDEQRQSHAGQANGLFTLTGSANVMALPDLADALVGRVRILTLLPISMGEFATQNAVIGSFFENGIKATVKRDYEEFRLDSWIHRATFPEIARIAQPDYEGWYQNYITTILQRDVRNLAEIDKLSVLPNLLKALALRAGSLLNDSALARDVGLNAMTYRRYRILLQHVFLTTTVAPWFRNVGKRFVKSPKLYFYDTGVLAHLLGVSPPQLKNSQSSLYGHLVENFVASELMKQLTLYPKLALYHYRTETGYEVDFVLETPMGKVVGIEVKARSYVTEADFSGLESLKQAAGKDFQEGIVLYAGNNVLPFGPDMTAVPLVALMMPA